MDSIPRKTATTRAIQNIREQHSNESSDVERDDPSTTGSCTLDKQQGDENGRHLEVGKQKSCCDFGCKTAAGVSALPCWRPAVDMRAKRSWSQIVIPDLMLWPEVGVDTTKLHQTLA